LLAGVFLPYEGTCTASDGGTTGERNLTWACDQDDVSTVKVEYVNQGVFTITGTPTVPEGIERARLAIRPKNWKPERPMQLLLSYGLTKNLRMLWCNTGNRILLVKAQ
jgi:hypothetical protein